jgi:PAS domain S-box-containing protein
VILVVDVGGRITFANQAVTSVLGLAPEAVVGLGAAEMVVWPERAVAEARLAGLGTQEEALDVCVRRPDGRPVWLEVRGRRMATGAAELVARDVTARHALQEERDRLAIAVEQSTDAVVLTDRDGRAVYVNDAFEHMHGVPKTEVLGTLPELWDPDEAGKAEVDERMATVLATGRWSGDVVHRHADGSEITALTRIVAIRDDHGTPAGFLGLVTDVTRERALEANLARAARMEAIGQLAGGVAHDFNNLLTAVLGHAELATLAAEDRPDVRAELEEITRAGERAQALTRQLLAFGRRSLLRPRVVDLGEVALGLEPMLRRLIGEDVSLQVVVDDPPGPVEVDASLLEHAIVNLIVNARDAMPGGGLIRVTAGRPDPGESPEGAWAMLRVTDTGTGIPPDVLERIFEPFFSTKPQGKGTGLGLAMVHGFVDQSGGQLRVSTHPNAGTKFSILLPVAEGARLPERPVPSVGRESGRRTHAGTILVAEDEAVLRAIVERALQNAGYTVLMADSGERAVSLAAEYPGPIDLLFTDIVMPGIHGLTLARALRSTRPETRVLITSGYTEDDVVRRGVDLADMPFLPKPYTPSGLVAAVAEQLAADPAQGASTR